MKYSLDKIYKIKSEGFNFTLSNDTIVLINNLAETVGAVSYSKTPIFPKKENKYKNYLKKSDMLGGREFKATTLAVREGNAKRLNEIRSLLNKISNKNFDSVKDKILKLISEINENPDENINEDFKSIINHIFEIASNNSFYSKLYACLYKELKKNWIVFEEVFQEKLDKYLPLFQESRTADPNKDFDLFCKINKENDKKRAMSAFLCNLYLENIISIDVIIDIINTLQLNVEKNIYDENAKISNGEIVENLVVIINLMEERLKINNKWSGLYSTFSTMSKMSVKEYPGLCNKVIFKYMDIIGK